MLARSEGPEGAGSEGLVSREADPCRDFAHTGPGTLAGGLMRSFWQPVALSEELPPGRAVPIRVMGEEYTLYRGQRGQPHVVAARCAHRGTALWAGWVEEDCLRCFYHGWKYDATGQCVEQAVEVPSFASKVRIASHPAYEYLGLVFAYFGAGSPPEPPRYPEFEADVVVDAATAVVPYNFFQNMENSVDTLHVSWVHRMSNFFADGRAGDFYGSGGKPDVGALDGMVRECSGEETEYGFIFRDVFDNGKVRISHFEMPNVLHIKVYPVDAESGWRDFVAWKVPIDDESYRNFNLTIAHVAGEAAERYRAHPQNPRRQRSPERRKQVQEAGEEILAARRRLTVEDVGDLARSVDLQDYIAQRGQGVIADRLHEQLGKSDRVIILLRRLWEREMHRIAEGQSPKRWRWPGYLEATTGA